MAGAAYTGCAPSLAGPRPFLDSLLGKPHQRPQHCLAIHLPNLPPAIRQRLSQRRIQRSGDRTVLRQRSCQLVGVHKAYLGILGRCRDVPAAAPGWKDNRRVASSRGLDDCQSRRNAHKRRAARQRKPFGERNPVTHGPEPPWPGGHHHAVERRSSSLAQHLHRQLAQVGRPSRCARRGQQPPLLPSGNRRRLKGRVEGDYHS